MPWLVLLLLIFTPLQDEAMELIRAFEALSQESVEDKIALLDRIDLLDREEGARFIARIRKDDPERLVRAHAFFLWAEAHNDKEVIQYLDSLKVKALLDFIPVVPRLTAMDGERYLISLFAREDLSRNRKVLFDALAARKTEGAFRFLKARWDEILSLREALELLPALMSMKEGRDPAFLEALLVSDHPFARHDGAVALLRTQDPPPLRKVLEFMEEEYHPLVRAGVLQAMAALGTPEAALGIIQAGRYHDERRLYDIVDALDVMPAEVVRQALPKDWFASDRPVYFQVVVLTLTSSPDRIDRITSKEVQILRGGLKNKSAAIRVCSAAALNRVSERNKKFSYRVKRFLGTGSGDTQWEVMHTIECCGLEDAFFADELLTVLKGRNWELKIKAAQVLSALGDTRALPLLEKCLVNRELLLRIAAIKALGRLGGKESIQMLIHRLPKETGRALWEISRSLTRVTGSNFGIDGAQWQKWWDHNRERFVPPMVKVDLWTVPPRSQDLYGFYGLQIDSHNIVYALDLSKSMQGEGIGMLRKELTQSLHGLTGEHHVNMVFFSGQVRRWQETLKPMGGEKVDYKAGALLRARYLSADGATNLYGALKMALSDPEVDSVILLSDGDPTAGEILSKGKIIEAVERINRTMQVTIHTISVGYADPVFMRSLATMTGGTSRTF